MGVFEHVETKQKVLAANTHLDNEGSKSRLESVGITIRTLKRVHSAWSGGGKLGIFSAGDFNSSTTQKAYLAMKDSGYMVDLHDQVQERDRYGDIITFTGFEPDKAKDEQGRLDFLFLGPCEADGDREKIVTPWQVDGYVVLPNVFEAGIYLSDHRAIVGDLRLQSLS